MIELLETENQNLILCRTFSQFISQQSSLKMLMFLVYQQPLQQMGHLMRITSEYLMHLLKIPQLTAMIGKRKKSFIPSKHSSPHVLLTTSRGVPTIPNIFPFYC